MRAMRRRRRLKSVHILAVILVVAGIGTLTVSLTKPPPLTPQPIQTGVKVIRVVEGRFRETDQPVMAEGGKLVVYFFTATDCVYCAKERIPFIEAMGEFGEWRGLKRIKTKDIPTYSLEESSFASERIEVRLYELDKQALNPGVKEFFERYSPEHRIPTLIIGGKYFRIGAYPGVGDDFKRNTYEITPSQEREIDNIVSLVVELLEEVSQRS